MTITGEHDTPLLETIAGMTRSSLDNVRLPAREVLLVRLACLVAGDAPRASYVYNLTSPAGAELSQADVEAVLVASAPLVGTARIASAADRIAEAMGYPISVFDQMARGQL